MIELCCAAPSALLPSLRRGDCFRIVAVEDGLESRAMVTPLMLHNILAAMADGSLRQLNGDEAETLLATEMKLAG